MSRMPSDYPYRSNLFVGSDYEYEIENEYGSFFPKLDAHALFLYVSQQSRS